MLYSHLWGWHPLCVPMLALECNISVFDPIYLKVSYSLLGHSVGFWAICLNGPETPIFIGFAGISIKCANPKIFFVNVLDVPWPICFNATVQFHYCACYIRSSFERLVKRVKRLCYPFLRGRRKRQGKSSWALNRKCDGHRRVANVVAWKYNPSCVPGRCKPAWEQPVEGWHFPQKWRMLCLK